MDDSEEKADLDRNRRLESFGIRVIRFTNNDVLNQLDGVIKEIEEVRLSILADKEE